MLKLVLIALEIIADIIVHFCPSLYSKFQIRDWLKVTSASNLTNLRSADVNLSQSRIWNLEWSEVQKRTIISAIVENYPGLNLHAL